MTSLADRPCYTRNSSYEKHQPLSCKQLWCCHSSVGHPVLEKRHHYASSSHTSKHVGPKNVICNGQNDDVFNPIYQRKFS